MSEAKLARNDSGTTMIELIVATAVFMSGMVALLGGLVTLSTHNTVADERARATNFARSTFEDMRGLTINQILAYDIPMDDVQAGTVNVAGIGTATVSAFAILPDGQGGFANFELGVDDAAALNVAGLPNPIEVRLVMVPVETIPDGYQASPMHYASSTMLPY